MKVKTMVGTLIFLIVLNIGVLGTIVYLHMAGQQPPIARFLNPEPRFEPPLAGEMERVDNLTPEQQQKMVQLVQSYQSEIEPLQEEIRVLEQEMFQLLVDQEEVDSVGTDDILRKIAEVRLEISKRALESLQRSKTFLTKEQQNSFIRRIMSTGRRPNLGPGPNGPNPPMLNRPFDDQ
ncbi:MAG: periplasmic heavy metal sensor [Bacteroidetes bacterium]|jgi:Spy/CpxP family protein refolding chaperone|nr:periplasmic heavy metal sensor [Bacteroidota bacterium]